MIHSLQLSKLNDPFLFLLRALLLLLTTTALSHTAMPSFFFSILTIDPLLVGCRCSLGYNDAAGFLVEHFWQALLDRSLAAVGVLGHHQVVGLTLVVVANEIASLVAGTIASTTGSVDIFLFLWVTAW